MKRISYLVATTFLLLVVFAAVQFVWAQANRASVTGTITDPSGALIPGVSVTATNVETGVPSSTVSNGDGIYVVPNLPPGKYAVEFKRDGFQTLKRVDITLISTEVARLDATLQIGAVTTQVTVTTDAPVLDLEKPTEGTNMNGKVVTELPLSIYGGGRSVEDFAVALTPGYSPYSSPYGAVINGGQWFTKDYTVDGTSGTANVQGDSMESGPTMEAVEELQAQTSGLDAQSAVSGGGVIAFNLKSGTNALHGSAFVYGHNELLDANTWTNDYFGAGKPEERAWDYGFSLGGPIIKNKTFFFGAFERFQQTDFRLNSGSNSVPTSDFMNGNFSALLGGNLCNGDNGVGLCDSYPASANPTPIPITDTNGQSLQARVGMIYDQSQTDGNGNPEQFAGNIIPVGMISPVAQKVQGFYQNYAPQFGGIDNNSRGLLQGVPNQTPNQFVVKLDHTLRDEDRLSASWIYNHRPVIKVDGGGLWEPGTTTGGPLSNGRYQIYWSHEMRLSETHTFSPHVLNVLNFTYNLDYNASRPTSPGNWNEQLGFGDTGADTFPLISFQDGSAGHSETFLGNTWQGNVSGVNIITGDSVTWTKGKHNFTFGGDFVAHQVNSRSGSGALSFGFTYLNTAGPGYPYDGFGYASFLLGLVGNKASESVAYNLYGRQKGMSLFAQDSYKVTPKLTLSMGLRWNYNWRFHEKNGNWANFDLNAIDPSFDTPGTLVFAKSGDDSFEKNEYWKNFGPSVGFAYQMLPKTVLRGSFGLIYNPVGVTFFQGVPDGFAPQLGVNQKNNFSWDGPGGTGVGPNNLFQATPSTPLGDVLYNIFPLVNVDPRALELGYSEAFNFGVQQELTPNMRLEIGYVGNRGHHLTDTSLAWNEGPTSEFLRLVRNYNIDSRYDGWICDPASAAAIGVPYPPGTYAFGIGFCGSPLAAISPSPQAADWEENYWQYPNLLYAGVPLGQSFYDSMVVDLVKRTGRGLTMDLSYTWSRQEGDSFSAEQDGGNGYYTGIQDFSNMRQAAHAVTGYDLAHVVKGFVAYQLPFGRGQRWLAGQNRVVNGILGGWTLTGVVLYNTGQPFEVSAANPYWPLWGDIYPVFNLSNFSGPSDPGKFVPVGPSGNVPAANFYMPPSVASNPAPGVLPPTPSISALRCPGQANEDASILKDFPMQEGRYRLSFRAEFYNLFNRHYYNINGCAGTRSEIDTSTFGQVTGVADNPRQGQFAVRFEF